MGEDCVSATRVINASAETVFAFLADPANHTAIDGTGWVRDNSASELLTGRGQNDHLRAGIPSRLALCAM
jgi:hypothetical protein